MSSFSYLYVAGPGRVDKLCDSWEDAHAIQSQCSLLGVYLTVDNLRTKFNSKNFALISGDCELHQLNILNLIKPPNTSTLVAEIVQFMCIIWPGLPSCGGDEIYVFVVLY